MSETAVRPSAADHASDVVAAPAVHTGERGFAEIAAKVRAGVPLDRDDGVALYRHRDLLALGALANEVRERLHGDRTYFNVNLHINPTNVCEADCKFCSFARLTPDMPQAYTMTVEQVRQKVIERAHQPITEVHLVNGLHPGVPFSYYTDILRGLKELRPDVHLKAYTAVEIHYFAEKYGMTYEQVLRALIEAGLGSMPGGGAEIFADRVRRKICRDKADARQWLEVHRTAHRLGLRTNCTMLYGTVETLEERVEHMLALRELQAETGGFQTFIPLAFHNEHNDFRKLPEPTGVDDLRTYAVGRLMLHNIPHIKAYWVMIGVKTAQIALSFGVDDLDGTVQEEKIYHMAGADTPMALARAELVRLIREAGRVAVERDTLYGVRWVDDGAPLPEIRMDASVPFSGHTSRVQLPVVR
ncbi:aminofutalosine synthase MqnE [Nannocystis punicea]|uniref:Aminodeoxyfutalosine synthase n=1 Tax=Nannocystis punicea TaxID=2995304 RepID=A0ABY7HH58_9BACT|nr:aminofutalosine synthase MqnE [Nannocystis poenicansa]WAS98646.1 aminofutalosine synthase MqnE [Nannocystis poenicansa]